MSSLVQQQNSYTQQARAYCSMGLFSLSGVYQVPLQIPFSQPVEMFYAFAVILGVMLILSKTFSQKDLTGALFTALSFIFFATSQEIAFWPQSLAIVLFVLFAAPVLIFQDVGTALSQVVASTAELRREMRRVTWPTVQETLKFVAIVSVFVVVAALFWAFVDRIIQGVFSILFYYLT